jgi:hypothetical protein
VSGEDKVLILSELIMEEEEEEEETKSKHTIKNQI